MKNDNAKLAKNQRAMFERVSHQGRIVFGIFPTSYSYSAPYKIV